MTDLGLRLLREGYAAIERDRHERRGDATYASRLLGRRAVVLSGTSGAELFYDEDVVERKGAVPPPLARLLFGRGAVHGLDGPEHRGRKDLFLRRLGPEQVASCAEAARAGLERALADSVGRELPLHPMLVQAYGQAVLGWAGTGVDEGTAARLSRPPPTPATTCGRATSCCSTCAASTSTAGSTRTRWPSGGTGSWGAPPALRPGPAGRRASRGSPLPR